jgi:membrane protease YdiL (CAAX protease family)
MIALFGALPVALSLVHAPRWAMFGALWLTTAGVFLYLGESANFSWRRMWEGDGWPPSKRRGAVLRFFIMAPLLAVFAWHVAPDRFLQFPLQRPFFWALVMALYPLLSVLPQEAVYRVFFFRRYEGLVQNRAAAIVLSAFFFGFAHMLFQNWIAPFVAGIGGLLFAWSYAQHRSLMWAVIEHALYGNLVFTLGLGWYFVHVPAG